MKRIVSVSIGSSTRNHRVVTKVLDQEFIIERIGTDGDVKKAIQLIKELDGKVDAFGMGGIDLCIFGKNNKKYTLKAALPIAEAARITPMVDGSGLKNTLERNVVQFVNDELGIPLKDKKVLLVCALDRYGMAQAFSDYGAQMVFGDMIFVLGIPIPIRKLSHLHRLAAVLIPVVTRLPFEMLYPTGQQQEQSDLKFGKFFKEADIIAGDYLYIKKHLPERLDGKIIVTNTVTAADVEVLREKGAERLITSTPEFEGRSFGTNVMEALIVSISGKRPEELTPELYKDLLSSCGFKHRVVNFK